ncbi:glutamate synthase [Rhizobium sp. Root708]|uniref:chaperone NapD n=1 Tax=Rhizobium sp. Root708 TaxID=1736592 RepID=UPI0006F41892|nr:chaperone NapD [Rhizobium sp. Root708]KRB49171.1 glutamate synthase [Rhizobium sp. Root708]
MAENALWHVSSAVIVTRPEHTQAIVPRIEDIEGVEIHGHDHGKIVVVIEGPTTGALGSALTSISLLDGVLAANMVFEQVTEEKHAEEPIPDTA